MSHIPSRSPGNPATTMTTPFTEDGALGIGSTVRLAAKPVDDGCDTILLPDTTSESPTTHQPEKNELTVMVKEAVGDCVFILCGAESNGTARAVRIAEGVQVRGTNGLLVVSPYYNRLSQVGLVAHVHAIVEAGDSPVMFYDIPEHTGLAFSDETLDALAQHLRIKAVKDTTGNVEQGVERMHRIGSEHYFEDDGLNFAQMTGRASGFTSVVGYVVAKKYREMIDFLDRDKVWGACELSYSLRPLVAAIIEGGQDAVMVRCALHLQGIIGTLKLYLPLVEARAGEIEGLQPALETTGFL